MVVKARPAVALVAVAGVMVLAAAGALRDARARTARSEVEAGLEAGLQELQAGRYREAEAPLRRALATAEHRLGEGDLDTGRVLNAMGLVDKDTARREEGRIFYRPALVIAERADPAEPQAGGDVPHNPGGP